MAENNIYQGKIIGMYVIQTLRGDMGFLYHVLLDGEDKGKAVPMVDLTRSLNQDDADIGSIVEVEVKGFPWVFVKGKYTSEYEGTEIISTDYNFAYRMAGLKKVDN
jgi:hypothetical protein